MEPKSSLSCLVKQAAKASCCRLKSLPGASSTRMAPTSSNSMPGIAITASVSSHPAAKMPWAPMEAPSDRVRLRPRRGRITTPQPHSKGGRPKPPRVRGKIRAEALPAEPQAAHRRKLHAFRWRAISGIVIDSSGSAIAAAHIAIANPEATIVRSLNANYDGSKFTSKKKNRP